MKEPEETSNLKLNINVNINEKWKPLSNDNMQGPVTQYKWVFLKNNNNIWAPFV